MEGQALNLEHVTRPGPGDTDCHIHFDNIEIFFVMLNFYYKVLCQIQVQIQRRICDKTGLL